MKCAVRRRNSLNRGDALAGNGSHGNAAGAPRFVIDIDATGTAGTDATAEFCAGELKLLADDPEERHIGIRRNREGFTVDIKINGHQVLPDRLLDLEWDDNATREPMLVKRAIRPNRRECRYF